MKFDFNGAGVRVITDEHGEVWFIARDVAELLDYVDTDQAIRTHCKGAQTCPVEITGQVRHVKVIPERDVYRLVMRSRLPAAEAFEEWVVGEVLPTIRKTGSYQRPMTPAEQPLAQAQTMVDIERRQVQTEQVVAGIENRVAQVEQLRYLDATPAGFESMTSIRARINLRLGIPEWVVNAVMRDVPGCPLPFALVRSKHASEGGQPYAIWPKADVTRRFDRFATECTFVTPERATHPDIQQGRFKLRPRSSV
ncbi:MAG: BRO family protein [Pseudomonas graminis]